MDSVTLAMSSRSLAICTGTSALLALAWNWDTLSLAAAVARDTFCLIVIDRLPLQMRRQILAKEYEGEMLEKRLTYRVFKGLPTIRALWHFSSINLRPRVRVGDPAPRTPVLLDGKQVLIPQLARGARPLLLNFGSCT